MNEAAANREVEALIQGYLDGSLTEPESGRLLSFLRREPALAIVIVEGLRADYLIRSVVAERSLAATSAALENVIPMPTEENDPRILRAPSGPEPEHWSAGLRHGDFEDMRSITPGRRPALQREVERLTRYFTRKTRWRTSLALAACLALLLGLSIWYFGPTMGAPVLAEVTGADVSIERGTELVPGANGIRLQSTDILRVGTHASATITFGLEKTRIELRADTELKLISWSKGKQFGLRSGTIKASVARQRPFKPMLVRTPQAEVRVLGTRFTLTATTNATRLDVAEGEVRLTHASDHTSVDVPADQYAIAAANVKLAALPQTGGILCEYWTNIAGDYFTMLLTKHSDYPERPSGQQWLDKFEAPTNWGTNYGARFRGFVHPPITGDYTFYIAASDGGELLLSRDDNPQNRIEIASAEYSGPLEWTKKPKQQSSAFTLTASRRYYVEVLKKQGDGRDHLAVAWKRPDGKFEIIPGEYLSPFKPKPKEKKP